MAALNILPYSSWAYALSHTGVRKTSYKLTKRNQKDKLLACTTGLRRLKQNHFDASVFPGPRIKIIELSRMLHFDASRSRCSLVAIYQHSLSRDLRALANKITPLWHQLRAVSRTRPFVIIIFLGLQGRRSWWKVRAHSSIVCFCLHVEGSLLRTSTLAPL